LGTVLLLLVIAASDRPSERSSPAAAVVVVGSLAAAAVLLREAPRMSQQLRRVNESAQRIATFLDREPPFRMAQQAQPLPRLVRQAELREVTLADRRGERLLDRVSMTFPIGAVTALVSDDKRSARAVVGLLTRLFDPAAGAVLYDDRDIRDGTLDTSRGQTAVAGERLLFTGSLRQNITCDDPALDSANLDRAVQLTGLDGLINSLRQGADTIIGDSAMHLDALAAFRVTLARALARNPAILVIVEPHLAKPEESAEVDQLLQSAGAGRALVVLPTRSATLRHASHVLVLGQGRLAAAGQHVQLVQDNAFYRHLVYTQFAK
jgi:ATP-binding cassette subfamily B protein